MQKKKAAIGAGALLLIAAGAILLTSQNKSTPAPKTAGKKYTKEEFIALVTPYAKAIGAKIGVPYKFIVAQICLETRYGNSELFQKYFNVGGVKAVKGEKFALYPTYEYIKGEKKKVLAKFAAYDSLNAGIIGYAKILINKYFKKYANKTTDAKKYAALLQSGSPKYATDINYVTKIHKLIDTLQV